MKKSQPAPSAGKAAAPAPDASVTASTVQQPRRRLKSTAEILARGVSLEEVLRAVKLLRPPVNRVG